MTATLVVVFLQSSGFNFVLKHYQVSDLATCHHIIKHAVMLPPGHDDRRGVQAMYCIEAPK